MAASLDLLNAVGKCIFVVVVVVKLSVAHEQSKCSQIVFSFNLTAFLPHDEMVMHSTETCSRNLVALAQAKRCFARFGCEMHVDCLRGIWPYMGFQTLQLNQSNNQWQSGYFDNVLQVDCVPPEHTKTAATLFKAMPTERNLRSHACSPTSLDHHASTIKILLA